MNDEEAGIETSEISLARVLREEFVHLRPEEANAEPPAELSDVLQDYHRARMTALCFSGGGIRSATFGLGIVEALAKAGLLDKFDYLSTVSGGGYLGSWLSAWIRREQINKFEAESKEKELELKNELAAAQRKHKELNAALAEYDDAAKTPAPGAYQELKKSLEESRDNIERLRFEISLLETELFERYNAMQTTGVEEVQRKLKECTIPMQPKARLQSPNPEPKQLQFLREYSNYMSPKVGLLSADTWTLLSIYVRNLFLNWTVFIPLLCAFLLVPRVLYEITVYAAPGRWMTAALLIGLLAGITAVVLTVGKLPSKSKKGESVRLNTDTGVFVTVILPLVVMAFGATTFWAWYKLTQIKLTVPYEFLQPYLSNEFVNFLLFSVSTFVFGNIIYFLIQKIFSGGEIRFQKKEIFSAFLSSMVGGGLTWLLAHNFFDDRYFAASPERGFWIAIYLCLAVPLYLLSFSVGSTIFVGIYSRVATDEDREWLARQGAWILIVSGAWIVLNGLVLIAPQWLENLITTFKRIFFEGQFTGVEFYNSIVSLIVAISGFISLVGGFSGESLVKDEPKPTKLNKFLAVAPRIAAVVFLVFIFVSLAYVSGLLLLAVNGFLRESGWLGFLNLIPNSWIDFWLFGLIFLAFVGVVMAFFINVNKFSLHAAYRDRLIRAYLGASNTKRKGNSFTGFDDGDNFQLHRLKGQKPFHVINATLNLVNGKNLAWQNRKAASFTMSPLHCGNWMLGYRRTNEYCRNGNLATCAAVRFCNRQGEHCASTHEGDCQLKGKALRLGTAMTISGAAANPNMGYYSSSVVTFLMTLFNIRLGWWLGNTGQIGDQKDWFGYGKKKFYEKPSPSVAILPLLNETFGRTDENKRFLNVTDGGHFENLGIYEMVLRRCKLIVLSDAAADERFTWGEISNAIEKCRVDLGVDIKFNREIDYLFARHRELDEDEDGKKRRFAIAEIYYPEKDEKGKQYTGHLLYIRPTYYGDEEPTPIKHYANANRAFPHQSTADQLYDEKQFEAYRALGFFIVQKIMERNRVKELFSDMQDERGENGKVKASDLPQPLTELLGAESSDAV